MVKVTPPDAVEEVGEETEQNGQKEGWALEAVACGAHGQCGLLRVIKDFYLVAGFAGRGFIAQQVRGGDSVAGGRGELQHRVVTQQRAAAAPGFSGDNGPMRHNGGDGGLSIQREHQLGVGPAFMDAEAEQCHKSGK